MSGSASESDFARDLCYFLHESDLTDDSFDLAWVQYQSKLNLEGCGKITIIHFRF